MPTTTTTYSFNKPVVGADEDSWGGYLNGNWDSVDDLLDGTTPVTGIDINSGTLDGVTIGGTTAGAGTFTTLTANTSITGTLATAAQPNITSVGSLTSLDVAGSVTADGLTVAPDANRDVQVSSFGTFSMRLENTTVNAGGLIDLKSNGGVSVTSGSKSILKADGSNGDISFYEDTGTTPKFFWDASAESLGIGTTSPATNLHLSGATGPKLTLQRNDSATGNAWIQQRNNAGSVGASIQLYANETRFWADDGVTERMRIDSSGNLLVGTTSNSISSEGIILHQNKYIGVARDSATTMYLNRITNDGDILEFRKDNSTVGSIGTIGGSLSVGNADTGLLFNASSDNIYPWNMSTGAIRDAAIDLGKSNTRFKDLYLSGGVYLGGTGSANKLDDYEEGTWTPVVIGTTTAGTGTYTTQTGAYTKVGDLVYATLYLGWSAHTGTGGIRITGLPFTVSNAGSSRGIGSVEQAGLSYTAGGNLTIRAEVNSTYMNLNENFNTGGFNLVGMDTSVSFLFVNVCYKAA